MKKIVIAILICSSFLSACSKGNEIKEKSSKVESNKKKNVEKEKNVTKVDPNEILLPKEYFNILAIVFTILLILGFTAIKYLLTS